MNIHEISDKSGIAVRSLRKLETMGVLRCDPPNEILDSMIYMLGRGQQLTVMQLVTLVEKPEMLLDLGKHAARASAQLDALGEVEPAPRHIVAEIDDAASGKEAAAMVLAIWLQQIIPENDTVGHHYLAVRLLLGAPENMRKYIYARIPKALLNVRALDRFAGWSSSVSRGGKGSKMTRYHRPKSFDL